MKTGPQKNTLQQKMQEKLKQDLERNEKQIEEQLESFTYYLNARLNAEKLKIEKGMVEFSEEFMSYSGQNLSELRALQKEHKEAWEIIREETRAMKIEDRWTAIAVMTFGALTSFLATMLMILTLIPERINPPLIPSPTLESVKLQGAKLTRGLGGLGVVIKLPSDTVLAKCNMLDGNGLCLTNPRLKEN